MAFFGRTLISDALKGLVNEGDSQGSQPLLGVFVGQVFLHLLAQVCDPASQLLDSVRFGLVAPFDMGLAVFVDRCLAVAVSTGNFALVCVLRGGALDSDEVFQGVLSSPKRVGCSLLERFRAIESDPFPDSFRAIRVVPSRPFDLVDEDDFPDTHPISENCVGLLDI